MKPEELKKLIAGCCINDRSVEEAVRRVMEYTQQSAQERYEKADKYWQEQCGKASSLPGPFGRSKLVEATVRIASGLTEKTPTMKAEKKISIWVMRLVTPKLKKCLKNQRRSGMRKRLITSLTNVDWFPIAD